MPESPTEEHAATIANEWAGSAPDSVTRFPTGLAHFVYDVAFDDGRTLVVRLGRAEDQPTLAGAVYWSNHLRPLGVPLPRLYGSGVCEGLPYMVLERLPGTDLGHVYSTLTPGERHALAKEIVRIQQIVGALPRATGYGYSGHADGPFTARSWPQVIRRALERSRGRIIAAGIVDTRAVDRVAAAAAAYHRHLDDVPATLFLDDTTTKNVIVNAGRLSGIVDVDQVCAGDPLFTVGLTTMALRARGEDTDYVDYWCDALELSPERRQVLRLYVAVFCVDFLAEIGHSFNRGHPAPKDDRLIARYHEILDDELGSS